MKGNPKDRSLALVQTILALHTCSKHGGARHVPLNDTAVAILRALPSRCQSDWGFPSQTGITPVNVSSFLHRVFIPAVRRASIANFRWHDLRHTFASRLAMAGVDLRTIQEPKWATRRSR
jgi:integrase